MRNRLTLNALGTLGIVVAMLLSPNTIEAQFGGGRPSLGGLQLQIDQMLSGDPKLPFQAVSFGQECFIGPDPTGGLCFSDSRFFFKPPPGSPLIPEVIIPGGLLRFGDECTIGIDPRFPGITESDPNGFRLVGDVNGDGALLRFGDDPDDLCTIGLYPGVVGLVLQDPGGLIISNIGSSGKDGVRFVAEPPALGSSQRLVISNIGSSGKDGVSIDLGDAAAGIAPRFELPQGLIQFGPDCCFGIDPLFTGIVEKDPGGLRLLGQNGEGMKLIFGPTDDCRIFVDPNREPGIRLSDLSQVIFQTPEVRLLNGRLRFGGFDPDPDNNCSIGPVFGRQGMVVLETFGTFFESPVGPGLSLVDVDGEVVANQFTQRSSAALKENVRTIDNALETVRKLRGVYFDWKKEALQTKAGESPTNVGFIAEEVAMVISEAVSFDETGTKAEGVKYANLVSLVVESVKEQQTQIEAQQAQIVNQQEQIDEQQQLIAELQNAVAELQAMQKK